MPTVASAARRWCWGMLAALVLMAGSVRESLPAGAGEPGCAGGASQEAAQAEVQQAVDLLGIPVEEYASRRAALREAVGDGIVVLAGARLEDYSDVDRYFQSHDFLYLTGCDVPGAYLVLLPDALPEPHELLYLPPEDPYDALWHGAQPAPGPEADAIFGLATANAEEFERDLAGVLGDAQFRQAHVASGRRGRLLTIVPRGHHHDGLLHREREFAEQLLGMLPAWFDLIDVRGELHALRRVKSEAEVALIQRACDITAEAHRAAARCLEPGMFEYEVNGVIFGTLYGRGAERPAFASIVGAGPNSCVLHYFHLRSQVEQGDLVLVDIGAQYHYYSADVTRTFPASGRFTPRQREIYELVLAAQRHAEEAFRPGESTLRGLHYSVVEFLRASALRAVDAQGREQTMDAFFPHGLDHYLGMDVHDVGMSEQPLVPGTVFTLEPGIYVASEEIGIRIEDDYLATEDGLVKLTADLPSEPDDIEAMMAEEWAGR